MPLLVGGAGRGGCRHGVQAVGVDGRTQALGCVTVARRVPARRRSGLGEASAEHLAELGARIENNGGQAPAVAVDVTDATAVRATADRVAAELGGADLLFNNAGVMLFHPAETPADGGWRTEVDLNVTGLTNVVAAFTPQLVNAGAERGVADLINTSSVAAHSVLPAFAVYAATKAYVSHLSRTLRAEPGAKQVRSDAVSRAPGHRADRRVPREPPAAREPSARHRHADRPARLTGYRVPAARRDQYISTQS
ncbi:SDR family oxidoreductase [Streptomyces sp. NPDC020192]|uniref:SDR family oxidoreductase n=1 Tax=Streptomyces sp. NPDC020192 TaxID=3365066 RepID=UPI0037A7CEF1